MGYAMLTAATQQFLDTCPAVESWTALTDDVAVFDYDTSKEVHGPVPHGVYFNLETCQDDEHERNIREAVRERNDRVMRALRCN